jgi:hypothetical protein
VNANVEGNDLEFMDPLPTLEQRWVWGPGVNLKSSGSG